MLVQSLVSNFNPYGHKVSLRVTKVEFDFDVSVRLSDHLNCLPGRISDQVSPRNSIENVERLGHNPKIFKLFFYVFFPTWAEIIQHQYWEERATALQTKTTYVTEHESKCTVIPQFRCSHWIKVCLVFLQSIMCSFLLISNSFR